MVKGAFFKNNPLKRSESEPELKKIRNQIDQIDDRIIDLLEKRLSLALKTVAFKTNPQDKERETEILTRLINKPKKSHYVSPNLINQIYSLIFRESLKLQKAKDRQNKASHRIKINKENRHDPY